MGIELRQNNKLFLLLRQKVHLYWNAKRLEMCTWYTDVDVRVSYIRII